MRLAKHICLVCVVLYALVGATGASASLLTRTELDLLAAINDARAAYGLKPLRVDPALTRAARAHSLDELRRGYFDHGPFAARLFRFGVRGPYLAENLAWGLGPASSPTAIVRMWLRSPLHRANLL